MLVGERIKKHGDQPVGLRQYDRRFLGPRIVRRMPSILNRTERVVRAGEACCNDSLSGSVCSPIRPGVFLRYLNRYG